MKFNLYLSCRRNPLVAAAMFRRAGTHRPSGSSRRQQAASSLRHELKEMKHIP
jgi:hypothetical protein